VPLQAWASNAPLTFIGIYNMSSENNYVSGAPLGVLLTVLFVALKLTGVIAWSWIWVLSPLWIPIGIGIGIMIVTLVLLSIFAAAVGILGAVK